LIDPFADYIQYGFAGFAFVLLGVVVWMFRVVTSVVDENTKVITQFVDMVKELRTTVGENKSLLDRIHNLMLRRSMAREDE
jgi:hypothetical protein